MSKFLDTLLSSSSSLKFVEKLATDPNLLNNSYTQLRGVPIKKYPSQKYENGTDAKTLSYVIFNQHHPEVDRTGFGHWHLYGLLTNDLNTYPGVDEESFRKAQQCIFDAIKIDGYDESSTACAELKRLPQEFIDHDKFDALVVLLGIHDLAKMVDFHEVAIKTAKKYGIILDVKEHDEVAWKILTSANEDCIRELYPDFANLNQIQRNRILGALKGRVNPGRLYQLEGTAGELDQGGMDSSIIFDLAMYKAYHFLDLGSIRGNYFVVEGEPLKNAQGKRGDTFWNKFIISNFIKVLVIAGKVLCGELTPVQGYEQIAIIRTSESGADLRDPIERAANRIFCMMKTRDPGLDFAIIVTYLKDNTDASTKWKNDLVKELNESGYGTGERSVCVGYGPDLAQIISNGMRAKKDPSVGFKDVLEVFAQSYYNCIQAVRKSTVKNLEIELNTLEQGQITIELEQVTKVLAENENYMVFYQNLPSVIPAGDGFVVDTLPE